MSRDRHRPRYHFTAPSHWINDPNGLAFHEGRYHLYYQYNPKASHWGDIHWGHATSADLVHWQDEGVALAPSPGHDAGGCFSGSFALVNGEPTLYYTGYTPERQVQCVATSTDMHHWTKQPQRTLVNPPEGVAPSAFRDPYVFQHDGWWYMVVGASLRDERGQVLLYRSADGIDWVYRHVLYTSPTLALGRMWECPNFFPVGPHSHQHPHPQWVLSVSVWPNLGAHVFVGRFEDERFIPESDAPLDVDGGAFAHLTLQAPDGRLLQWAWLNEQREQHRIDADGWAGALTVPREVGVDARGRFALRPVDELAALRQAPVVLEPSGTDRGVVYRFAGACLDVAASFTLHDRGKVGLTLLASPDGKESTRIVYVPEARRLLVERSRSSQDEAVRRQDVQALLVLDEEEPLHLRVLLDHSVLEVYANDRVCLSTRLYPVQEDSVQGSVFVEGAATVALQAWHMGSVYRQPR